MSETIEIEIPTNTGMYCVKVFSKVATGYLHMDGKRLWITNNKRTAYTSPFKAGLQAAMALQFMDTPEWTFEIIDWTFGVELDGVPA